MRSRRLFLDLLRAGVVDAEIRVAVADDVLVAGGTGGPAGTGEHVTIRVNDERFFGRVLRFGNLGMGEAFMDRDFEVEDGTLDGLLTILARNDLESAARRSPGLALRIGLTRLRNGLRGRGRNVRAHYDLGDELFEAFLDPTLTYSCGYAEDPEDDLERLQANKLERLCRKLRLRPGLRLLDIGCGYGGLLLHAARHHGAAGVGVTISRRHHARGTELIQAAGLADRVRLELADYATVRGRFDRIVSVGMMEHVPRRTYPRFFRCIGRLLAPRGLGLVHTIGRTSLSNDHDPFIQRYVFPASSTPRLSEIALGLERQNLAVLDVENVVRHYALTTRAWLTRFEAARDRLDPRRFDDRMKRMWEYYLACGVAAARATDGAVFQVLFTNDHVGPRPLQRI